MEKPYLREELGRELEQRCYRIWTNVAMQLIDHMFLMGDPLDAE